MELPPSHPGACCRGRRAIRGRMRVRMGVRVRMSESGTMGSVRVAMRVKGGSRSTRWVTHPPLSEANTIRVSFQNPE